MSLPSTSEQSAFTPDHQPDMTPVAPVTFQKDGEAYVLTVDKRGNFAADKYDPNHIPAASPEQSASQADILVIGHNIAALREKLMQKVNGVW